MHFFRKGKDKRKSQEQLCRNTVNLSPPLLGNYEQTWNKIVLGLLPSLPFVASKQPQTEQTPPREQQRHLALEHQMQSWLMSLLTVPRQPVPSCDRDDPSPPEPLPPHLWLYLSSNKGIFTANGTAPLPLARGGWMVTSASSSCRYVAFSGDAE